MKQEAPTSVSRSNSPEADTQAFYVEIPDIYKGPSSVSFQFRGMYRNLGTYANVIYGAI